MFNSFEKQRIIFHFEKPKFLGTFFSEFAGVCCGDRSQNYCCHFSETVTGFGKNLCNKDFMKVQI